MSRREHIERLADEHHIEIVYDDRPYHGARGAWAPRRIAWLGEWGQVDDEIQYGIALHELGHVALQQGPPTTDEEETRKEGAASKWGIEHGVDLTVPALTALVHSPVSRLALGWGGEWDEDVQFVLRHTYEPSAIPSLTARAVDLTAARDAALAVSA